MNEYQSVEKQMNEIIQKRLYGTSTNNLWNYDKQVGQAQHIPPLKYQNVEDPPKVQFTTDIRKLIYNQNQFPQDIRIFNSTEWQLVNIAQLQFNPPKEIPSQSYIRAKKLDTKQIDENFGEIELVGKLKGKSNQAQYINYHFNLRNKCLVLYNSEKPQAGDKQLFYINFNERSFDYQSDATQYLYLRGDQKSFKIYKDNWSKQLIQKIQEKLIHFAFIGAYVARNQVPDWRVQDYLDQVSPNIGPINFQHENAIKDIVDVKQYREAVGAFCRLLQRNSRTRLLKNRDDKANGVAQTKAGEIYYPRWLKQTYKQLPIMQTWLSTNVLPKQNPLMSLKIKVNQNQKRTLLHLVKYIFPYMKLYTKRSLIVYESGLDDEDSRIILENINYPMYLISFTHNNLTQKALQHVILKSSDFQNQIIDFSHNKNLFVLKGVTVINMINNHPSIKKLYIKGCSILEEQCNQFFDALSSNICLSEIQFDYEDFYNQNMVEFLCDFDAEIQ